MDEQQARKVLSGHRVLVVNDTQEILELFDDVLTELGLQVVQMSYAPRELDRVREAAPDLIILDLVFGEQERVGWQLLQKVKMDRALAAIPVIVCTAAIRMAQELQGYLAEQGVVVVIKPFTVDQLEEAVVHALTQQSAMPPRVRPIRPDAPRTGPEAAPTARRGA